MHLSQLLTGGFLSVSKEGRHRYYCIANRQIAQAVEALGTISTPPGFKRALSNPDLCYARTCYDHLAGELGVALTDALEQNRVLVPSGDRDYDITREGEQFLAGWQIGLASLRNTRRPLARRCLDWTEKRYHLSGALGTAICNEFLKQRWITREKKTRVVHLSTAGRRELGALIQLRAC